MKAEPTHWRRPVASVTRCFLMASLLMPVTAAAQAIGQRSPPDPLSQIPRVSIPSTIKDGFTFADVGDLIGPGRPVGPLRDAEFVELYPPYMTPPRSVKFYMGIGGCSSANSAMMDSGGIFYAVVWMKN